MSNIVVRYMTVSADFLSDGINLSCWIGTAEFWATERLMYPHDYIYIGGHCQWLIHSNSELTPKVIQAIGETADRICHQGEISAKNRRAVNR